MRAAKMPGTVARLTKQDRKNVSTFLESVVKWSGKTWNELQLEAANKGGSYTTISGWHYGQATPEAPGLLLFLRAAGLVTDDYQLAVPSLAEGQAAAAAMLAALEKMMEEPDARSDDPPPDQQDQETPESETG